MIRHLAKALVLAALAILMIGSVRAVQTDGPMDIELRMGGSFQSTTYALTNNALSYLRSTVNGEMRKSAAVSAADRNDLARLIREFDLQSMKSDSPAGPDEPYYQLRISQNGGQIRLYCWLPDNSCHALSERLKSLFDAVLARAT